MSSVSELPGLLSGFISSPESVMFKDISIVSKDGQIHTASKIILAAHSNVLFSIFTHESDKTKNTFHLPTVTGSTLAIILDWMESGELGLDDIWMYSGWTKVVEVLETAEFLDIPLVSSLCQEWMVDMMTCNNVLGWGSGDLPETTS